MASVPQIEELTVEDILDMSRGKAQLLKYLPDERDWEHMDRKWLCDVVYTLCQKEFQQMIDAAVKERSERLSASKHLLVEMRPEFVQALAASQSFSCKCFSDLKYL